jgi:hypothetical protein
MEPEIYCIRYTNYLGKQSLKRGDYHVCCYAAEVSDEKFHPLYSRSPLEILQNSAIAGLIVIQSAM